MASPADPPAPSPAVAGTSAGSPELTPASEGRARADATGEKHRSQDVESALRRYRHLYDSAPVGFMTLDASGCIVESNLRAAAMFGLDRQDLLGRRFTSLVSSAVVGAVEGLLERARRRVGEAVIEVQWSWGDQPRRTAQVEAFCDGDGGAHLLVLTEVTERKRADALLQDARSLAQETKTRSELLARISHELRTPLNAVIGFAELLLTDPAHPLGEHQAAKVRHIANAGHHLLHLVNDVLDISRMDVPQETISAVALDVETLISECVPMVASMAAAQHVAVTLHRRDAGPCMARADRTRLRQVVLNVLTNAVKYNRPGGRVDVQVQSDSHHVVITVTDTGIGMDAHQMEHLFEPFNRLGAEKTATEGVGLGLTICKLLMEAMHGHIDIHSAKGTGTVVTLTLPRANGRREVTP